MQPLPDRHDSGQKTTYILTSGSWIISCSSYFPHLFWPLIWVSLSLNYYYYYYYYFFHDQLVLYITSHWLLQFEGWTELNWSQQNRVLRSCYFDACLSCIWMCTHCTAWPQPITCFLFFTSSCRRSELNAAYIRKEKNHWAVIPHILHTDFI